MSFLTTVDQARELLNASPDAPAAEIWQAAKERAEELRSAVNNPRASAPRRAGAGSQLAKLTPLLPLLEIEVELTTLEATPAGAPSALLFKRKLEAKSLQARVGALPAGDERTFFLERLAAAINLLHPAPAEVAPPKAPPQPRPPDPSEKILPARIASLRAAVDRGERDRALVMLEAARDLCAALHDDVTRGRFLEELSALEAQLEAPAPKPPSPPAPEPDPQEKKLSGMLATTRDALAKPDLPEAQTLLAAARALIPTVRSDHARSGLTREIDAASSILAGFMAQRFSGILAAVEEALQRRDTSAAAQFISDAAKLASDLSAPGERTTALEKINGLRRRLRDALSRPTKPDPGFLLTLVPAAKGSSNSTATAAIRLVARSVLLIGREMRDSPSIADFLVPDSFRAVGRVHATLSRKNDAVTIQDGSVDKGKSANGSKLDGDTLSATPVAVSFAQERTLTMGTVYPVLIRHCPGAAPGGPPLGAGLEISMNRTLVIRSLTGAIRIRPGSEQPAPFNTVWLFTDATLGSDPECALVMPGKSFAGRHARIHHWQEGFWLESLDQTAGVTVGEVKVAKGEAWPLRRGDILSFGENRFEVTIGP